MPTGCAQFFRRRGQRVHPHHVPPVKELCAARWHSGPPGLRAGCAQFFRRRGQRVHPHHVPPVKEFFIMPAIYWTMATLAIENTIFSTPGVGPDEYTQSVHGPSPGLKLVNVSCSDAVIGIGLPASLVLDW